MKKFIFLGFLIGLISMVIIFSHNTFVNAFTSVDPGEVQEPDFSKTEGNVEIEMLQGPQGPVGKKGPTGDQGPAGPVGGGNNLTMLTGQINDGQSIPVPSGFSNSQCKWFSSVNKYTMTGDVNGDDIAKNEYLNGRQVTAQWWDCSGDCGRVSERVNYFVICNK